MKLCVDCKHHRQFDSLIKMSGYTQGYTHWCLKNATEVVSRVTGKLRVYDAYPCETQRETATITGCDYEGNHWEPLDAPPTEGDDGDE